VPTNTPNKFMSENSIGTISTHFQSRNYQVAEMVTGFYVLRDVFCDNCENGILTFTSQIISQGEVFRITCVKCKGKGYTTEKVPFSEAIAKAKVKPTHPCECSTWANVGLEDAKFQLETGHHRDCHFREAKGGE
jgi:hypothetical protein